MVGGSPSIILALFTGAKNALASFDPPRIHVN